MADVRGFLADHRLGVTIVTAGLVVLGGVAVANTPDAGSATVTAVVDGDTIDVHVDGAEQRVRLLGVDTPEPGECLHEEAIAFLEERIPPGTEVHLEFDEERTDGQERLLAGVVEGGRLVNAEIARNGLGVAVLVEPNGRFFDDVLAARDAGAAEGLGLFSDGIACTLPTQVREYVVAVDDLEAGVGPGTLAEIDGWVAESAAVVALGATLTEVLAGDDTEFPLLAYTGPRWSLRGDVDAATHRLAEIEETLVAERRAEEQRIEAETERREREAEAQREREEAARRAAAEHPERRAADEPATERQEPPSGGSAYYTNCSAARAAGAAPAVVGEAGYGRHLDRDGDGIGCE